MINNSPFLSHWTTPIGDPDIEQLKIALSPEFIAWKFLHFTTKIGGPYRSNLVLRDDVYS